MGDWWRRSVPNSLKSYSIFNEKVKQMCSIYVLLGGLAGWEIGGEGVSEIVEKVDEVGKFKRLEIM